MSGGRGPVMRMLTPQVVVRALGCACQPYRWQYGRRAHAATDRAQLRIRGLPRPPVGSSCRERYIPLPGRRVDLPEDFRDSSMPYCRVFPGMRFRLSSRVFRWPSPQCRTTRQLAYSFTKVAPLCFTDCFMMFPLASTLHPWVPPPCSPGFLHLAPLGSSTFLPGVAPPSSPLCFTGCFMMLPLASTLLPWVPPPSSPGFLHLAPRGSSTLLPWVPPPSSPEFLHLPPRVPPCGLPTVLSYWL